MANSISHIRSNTLHSEFASAEMSLHAIYLHEVTSWPEAHYNQVLRNVAYIGFDQCMGGFAAH